MYETTYHRPASLAEAAKLFSGSGDAAYISGGHTLLPAMKARLAAPKHLIDVRNVPELKGIQVSGDTVTIGGATTHFQVANSSDVKKAIAWYRGHAEEHGADPDFLCVTGGSAGGHLTALVGLTPNEPEYQEGFEAVDTSMRAVVPF